MTHICIFLGHAVQCHFNTFQYLTLTTLWCCFVKSHISKLDVQHKFRMKTTSDGNRQCS